MKKMMKAQENRLALVISAAESALYFDSESGDVDGDNYQALTPSAR